LSVIIDLQQKSKDKNLQPWCVLVLNKLRLWRVLVLI
jgi:hypothetical protein